MEDEDIEAMKGIEIEQKKDIEREKNKIKELEEEWNKMKWKIIQIQSEADLIKLD